MNNLVLLLFASIFSLDYLCFKLNVLPRVLTWTPDFLSLFAIAIIQARFLITRTAAVEKKYIILFLLLLTHMLIGIMLESVPPGAIVAGLRNYLKFLPFFFIPVVYCFSEQQMRQQFWLLCFFVLIQTPLAVFQRFVQFANRMHTGDPVTGTATSSGALAIVMVCAIAMLTCLYLKGKIKTWMFAFALPLFVLPITLNETKASLILLPIALIAPTFLRTDQGNRLKTLLPLAGLAAIVLVAFIVIFDKLGGDITSFNPFSYAYRGVNPEYDAFSGYGNVKTEAIGRIDSIIIALRELSDDAFQLAFGLGMGNVSISFLSGLSGTYAEIYQPLGVGTTALGDLIWELGIIGVLLYLIFFYIAFVDARRLSSLEGLTGTIGLWWSTVMILMTVSLVYKNVFTFNETGYVIWYFCGYIASMHYRWKHGLLPVQPRAESISSPPSVTAAASRAPSLR